MAASLGISWALSTVSGYGIYGLQVLMQFLRRGGDTVVLTHMPSAILLPPMVAARVEPALSLGHKIAALFNEHPEQNLALNHPVLHAAGNDFAGFPTQDRVTGQPNIGCAAMEHKSCNAHGRAVAKSYHKLIAISRWNEKFLREFDLAPVHLCYQGIDTGLFCPGPSSGLWKDRFVVYSGGKFEFRKAQDIVVRAFKIFQARHPEALLVVSWQNNIAQDPAPFLLAGHISELPELSNGGMQIGAWLLSQGLPSGSFFALPFTPNLLMPSVLRECDVAVFPNRCEGGTNLVAMEAMACGVPTFVANNTGQKDLVDLLGCGAFSTQTPVKAAAGQSSLEDWGETDLDEVVAALEKAYTDRAACRAEAARVAEKIKAFDWRPLNDILLDVVFEETPLAKAQT